MSEDKLLDDYLSEVGSLASIPAHERMTLLARARLGEANARKRYIECLLLETASIATSECPPGMRPLDAIQEANVILVRLVDDDQTPDPAAVLDDAVRGHLAALTGG